MPGIEMSSTTTSGWSARAADTAVCPSVAEPTTWQADESTVSTRARMAWLSSTSKTRTGSDDVMFNGILNQFGGRLDLQLLHHAVLVKRHRSRREIQHAGDLFHR